MKIHAIMTYFNESHDEVFYILADDDSGILHALNVIRDSHDVTYYEVDGQDGPEFYDVVFDRVYPGFRTSASKVNKSE